MSSDQHGAYRNYFLTALTRHNRASALLNPAAVLVDERTMLDDLMLTGALSGYINFFNSENQIQGTWHTFFGKSEPVLLAGIASTDLKQLDADFSELFDAFRRSDRDSKKIEIITKMFQFNLMLAMRINHWYVHLSKGEYGNVQKEFTNQIAGRLRRSLYMLRYIGGRATQSGFFPITLNVNLSHFNEQWFIEGTFTPPSNLTEHAAGGNALETLVQALRRTYHDFFQAITYLVEYTRTNFDSILLTHSNNRPDISLFLAFLKMIEKSRIQLNTFTRRHLDYYYKDILRSEPLGHTPDYTFVTFTLADGEIIAQLPAGTLLEAGKDAAGQPLYYATEKALSVNKTEIAALRTLYVSRNPDVVTWAGKTSVPMVKNIYSSADPLRANNGEPIEWWSLTGTDQHYLSKAEGTMQHARLGFSVASPAFFMAEGKRDITVTFIPDAGSREVARLHTIIAEARQQFANNETGAEFYLMHKAFNIAITGPEGWIAIPRYSFTFDQQTNELVLRFSLGLNDAAVTAVDPALHGADYSAGWPVLRLLLNSEDAPVYAYSLLSGMPVNNIKIDTVVSDVRKLSLYNNSGPLTTDKPFQPFGPQPGLGTYLLIGSSEVFSKHLTALSIKLRWYDLPANGFGAHYSGYSGTITNESFRAGISLLQNGWFQPQPAEQQQVRLFENAPAEHPERGIPVLPETQISPVNLTQLGQRATWETPVADLQFLPETQNSFLRIELTSPAGGFGAAEYPALLTDTMMRSGFKKKPLPLPSPPHVPQISSVTMSYKASFDASKAIGENNEPLLHLYRHYPFGTEKYQSGTRLHQARLLPVYTDEGYLFIGLRNFTPPQPVTLFFHISEESLHPEEKPSQVNWHYLSNNTWKKLAADRVLADGTQNFITPGIVELDLPGDITADNTIMEPGLHWICVSVPNRTQYTNYVKAIYTQAAKIVRKDNGNDLSQLGTPLAAGSITRISNQTAAVKTVMQPLASRGGKPPEQPADMYQRLSERLAHRNRAVLPSDYERIILQEFSDVFMAKCFPNLAADGSYKPGNVLLVVMPDVARRDDVNLLRPKDSYANIKQITDFLKVRSSPHISIFVRNPLYERVKVIAAVRFKPGSDSGFFLRKLNEDTRRHLSPWLYDDKAEPRLGGEVSRADIAGFIERLAYIDFMTSLSVVVTRDNGEEYTLLDTADEDGDANIIRAGSPWSILVTAAQHQYEILSAENQSGDPDQPVRPVARGIGNLILVNDFIITN
jgi:hypothetical protein